MSWEYFVKRSLQSCRAMHSTLYATFCARQQARQAQEHTNHSEASIKCWMPPPVRGRKTDKLKNTQISRAKHQTLYTTSCTRPKTDKLRNIQIVQSQASNAVCHLLHEAADRQWSLQENIEFATNPSVRMSNGALQIFAPMYPFSVCTVHADA